MPPMTRPAAPLDELLARALGEAPAPAGDEVERRVFDAAIEVLAERGTEHATMDDIAARSGVGRATLFRRFGGKDELLVRALVGEVRRLLDDVAEIFARVQEPTERIAETFVAMLRLADRPLLRDARHQADVVTALARGKPSPLELTTRFVAAFIAEGQRTGALAAGDPAVQADAMVRLALGYLLVPGAQLGDEDARRVARLVFAPIAGAPAQT